MSEWQPISTAPTNDDAWNVPMLVWVEGECRFGVRDWEDCQNLHLWLDIDTGLPLDGEPTHWMPLPEPPDSNPKILPRKSAQEGISD